MTMKTRTFFDEYDKMADKACDAIKQAARRYVAHGAIADSGEITSLSEAKAALAAALTAEANQWRFRGEITDTEVNLRNF